MKPVFTVLMPNYNTKEAYLRSAFESILQQSFDDFEFIIIDDGSEQDNVDICQYYAQRDKRVKFLENPENLGIAATLNKGLDMASGQYIARMDSDDISDKRRLEEIYKFLQKNPQVDLVGSFRQNIGESRKRKKYYTSDQDIRANLFFQSSFTHPAVCFKRQTLEKYGLRYNVNSTAEDYDLWLQCAKLTDFVFANIDKYLLKYRVHPDQLTRQGNNVQNGTLSVIKEALDYVNCFYDEAEFTLFIDFVYTQRKLDKSEFELAANLFKKLLNSDTEKLCANTESLAKVFTERFIKSSVWQYKKYSSYNKECVLGFKKYTNAKIAPELNILTKVLG